MKHLALLLFLAGCGAAGASRPEVLAPHPAPVLAAALAPQTVLNHSVPGAMSCVGDSITGGNGAVTLAQTFCYLLGGGLNDVPQNLGISGMPVTAYLTQQIPHVTPGCDLATLEGGTNDERLMKTGTETMAQFQAAYQTAIDDLHTICPTAVVAVLTIIGPAAYPATGYDPIKDAINAFILAYSGTQPWLIVVDVNADPLLHGCALHTSDCVHLTAAGQMEYAWDIWKALPGKR